MVEALRRCGFLVERNVEFLPGRSELFSPRRGVAVFVHRCFCHGCPRHFRCPKNNHALWQSKIESNRRRDRRTADALRRRGYSVVTVWEHEEPSTATRRIAAISRRPSAKRRVVK